MVRVCCACGAQDRALKLVAEAQAARQFAERGAGRRVLVPVGRVEWTRKGGDAVWEEE